MIRILQGDCRDVLKTLPDASINCCVTSPPYWGLRDYRHNGQIGLERTPEDYVAQMVAVFREVRRALRDDGTLWLNLGDSYTGYWGKKYAHKPFGNDRTPDASTPPHKDTPDWWAMGLKPKELVGIPWRVAFALQAEGWWLRSDIIWSKPQVMPESVTDRCTKSHEYIFMLAKAERYYFDQDAIKEPCVSGPSDIAKMLEQKDRLGGKNLIADDPKLKASSLTRIGRKRSVGGSPMPDCYKGSLPGRAGGPGQDRRSTLPRAPILMRNKRDVWEVATASFDGAHFATFPPSLIRPCILAGCPMGGTVLDPFGGSGTTGEVAEEEGRNSILIELNPEYVELAKDRTAQGGLFCAGAGL